MTLKELELNRNGFNVLMQEIKSRLLKANCGSRTHTSISNDDAVKDILNYEQGLYEENICLKAQVEVLERVISNSMGKQWAYPTIVPEYPQSPIYPWENPVICKGDTT